MGAGRVDAEVNWDGRGILSGHWAVGAVKIGISARTLKGETPKRQMGGPLVRFSTDRARFEYALIAALSRGQFPTQATGLAPQTLSALTRIAAEHPEATAADIADAWDVFEVECGSVNRPTG